MDLSRIKFYVGKLNQYLGAITVPIVYLSKVLIFDALLLLLLSPVALLLIGYQSIKRSYQFFAEDLNLGVVSSLFLGIGFLPLKLASTLFNSLLIVGAILLADSIHAIDLGMQDGFRHGFGYTIISLFKNWSITSNLLRITTAILNQGINPQNRQVSNQKLKEINRAPKNIAKHSYPEKQLQSARLLITRIPNDQKQLKTSEIEVMERLQKSVKFILKFKTLDEDLAQREQFLKDKNIEISDKTIKKAFDESLRDSKRANDYWLENTTDELIIDYPVSQPALLEKISNISNEKGEVQEKCIPYSTAIIDRNAYEKWVKKTNSHPINREQFVKKSSSKENQSPNYIYYDYSGTSRDLQNAIKDLKRILPEAEKIITSLESKNVKNPHNYPHPFFGDTKKDQKTNTLTEEKNTTVTNGICLSSE